MDLFNQNPAFSVDEEAPLAARMRPHALDEFVGQEHILGPGKLLRRIIEEDNLTSAIFWGPAGCGKSTLAAVIAGRTASHFENFSAVTSGVPDLRKIIAAAAERKRLYGKRTLLFADEIHRFNKAQQDAFLPHVENGTVTLIGATTENPYFEVNSPLISRSRIFVFKRLETEHLQTLVENALKDGDRGLGGLNVRLEPEALVHLADSANGDARVLLNALELAALSAPVAGDGSRTVTLGLAEESLQQRALRYDKTGDSHYDIISAFIKSMRGSDPDAALYWMLRMLEAGEDPRFVARRVVVHAAEDVGLADPMALMVATSAAHAVEYVGMPEARIPLAEAVLYIACAHKSNSVVTAIGRALKDISEGQTMPVPEHLRDTSYRGAKHLGHGKGYKYPHDFPGHYVPQSYLPEGVKSQDYYAPSDQGHESRIRQRLQTWKESAK
ncbi:MAG: replication-associated recombination protein A [Armatimonadetes bacterium]|nr:replication-associated recombination protein A [Armatimonadota bacterium]